MKIDWDEYNKTLQDISKDVPGSEDYDYYITDHHPRFEAGINTMDEHIKFNSFSRVMEVGSTLPFFTEPLAYKYGFHVYISSIESTDINMGRLHFRYCNLNFDDLGEDLWDVVVITEVWEHLVGNLLTIRDKVIRSIKPGGFMYTSFPFGRDRVSMAHYNRVLKGTDGNPYKASRMHLREFSMETSSQFLNVPEIEVIDSKIIPMPKMDIRGVLCQKYHKNI